MDIESLWDKALQRTELLRTRARELSTDAATSVPYIFLAESSLNHGDTVVRRGHVLVERAALILPTARFEGFEFDQELQLSDDGMLNFLLVRGIRFPSMRYRHELSAVDLREGPLGNAADHFQDALAHREDVDTGLVIGPEDAWQFSMLIMVAHLVSRSAEGDLRRLLDAWRRRQGNGE